MKEIKIPEGYEARIEGNKVILERKESEDERIRKSIVETIKQCPDTFLNPKNRDRMLAYLERQKEQRPVQDKEEREYVRTLKSLITDFLRGKDEIDREYYQKIYDWLDGRHIEQQPSTAEDIAVAYQMGLAEGRKEQKPEKDKDAIELTPKQDYSGLTDFERAIHRGFLCAGVENVPVDIIKDTAQDCLAQIKPAEWSEEDETCLEYALWCVMKTRHFVAKDACDLDACRSAEKWLKTLPERFNLRNAGSDRRIKIYISLRTI